MAEKRKERLAQALREYPTWGDAYLAATDALATCEAHLAVAKGDLANVPGLLAQLAEARADAERLAEAADDYVASRRVDAKERLIAALAAHEGRE